MLICHKGKKKSPKMFAIKNKTPIFAPHLRENVIKTTFGVVVQLVRIPACHENFNDDK